MFRDWLSIIITTAVAKNRDFRGRLEEEKRERVTPLTFENHPQTLGSKPLVRSGNWKASELAKPGPSGTLASIAQIFRMGGQRS